MKILKSWLQKHIEQALPDDRIIEQALILKSSEVEGIEKVKVINEEGLTIDDTVFDIKVLPDRAHYMLSHRGLAYDLCAVLNLTLKAEKLEIPKEGEDIKVKIESDKCSRYSATLIIDIENKESPEWLKSSLEALGARSINAIVDIANYAMFDTGQPLHVFDANKVKGGINIRFAKNNEKIETLDGKNITLKNNYLIIADEESPLAIAGIKGGKKAEVDINTKNIILESASFNPVSIRKTSFEISIRNDASKRYENEITPYLTEKGVSKFLDILENVFPNCKIGKINDKYKELPKTWNISINHKHIESILNFSILEKRVIEILEKLQCKVSVKNDIYEIVPPSERLDLIIAEDIIDELGRIEGLNKVKSVLPNSKNNHENAKGFLISEKIKDFFFEENFSEIQTRSFSNKGDIEVSYPMASDKGFLRTDLTFGLLESLKLSENNVALLGLEKIQIFEIGKVFPKSGERLDLCFGISYVKKIKNKDNLIKNELENLLKKLENYIGIKLNSDIISNYVYVKDLESLKLDLNLSSIKIQKGSEEVFKAFSNEPFIVRDIALFVNSDTQDNDVRELIRESAISTARDLLVKGPDIFDQFEKDGKKSIAFRMVFQANNRTLTDEEVNGFMEKVYEIVKKKGWQVR